MSQENVEVVRRMLQAFNDRDIEAVVAECDASVEWAEWAEQLIPGVDPLYFGHEGVRRWWTAAVLGVGEDLGSLEERLVGLKEADDTVIASVRVAGEGKSSGLRVQMHLHMVVTFRHGKVVRWQVFQTLAEALAAAGLRE
jgi:ketosteroid isomerase-like protein